MTFISKSVQSEFNKSRGVISEFQDGEVFCSITLSVGHTNIRSVNMTLKKPLFDEIKSKHALGDKVVCTYYPVSHKKAERWYSSLILLSVGID